MPTFSYVGYSQDGAKKRGTVEAPDRSNAIDRLRNDGIKVQALALVDRQAQKRLRLTVGSLSAEPDFYRFFSDLAMLTEAGLRLDRALKVIADEDGSKGNRTIASELLTELSGGKTPSDAFRKLEGKNPGAVALISSAEQSNKLQTVFAVIASDLERRRDRRAKIIEAVAYPAFLLLMMAAAIVLITLFLVPAILPVFEGTGVKPPILVRVLDGLGDFSRTWAAPGALVLLAVCFLYSRLFTQRRQMAPVIIQYVPFIGRILRAHWLSRYLRTLALLLGNSVSIEKALSLAATTCPLPRLATKFNAVRDGVVGGKHLPAALEEADIFPASVTSLVAIGDEVNNLPAVLDRAALLLESEAERLEKLLLGIMTPAITIVMGGLIGTLIISVMSALLSINQMSLQ